MNKKGLWLEIGALAMILITTFGVINVISVTEHIYVGDKLTKNYYDYKLCPEKVEEIEKENSIIFSTKEEAQQKKFNKFPGCVE